MSIKITIPNSSSDVLTFGSGNTPTAAQIAGIDSGSSNGQLALYTTASGTSTERVRVDASGNVGVGTTPSAWGSTAKAVQLPYGCAIANLGAGDVVVTQNAYFDNPNFKYASTTGVGSSAYRQIDGTHRWSYSASGTAGNNITFSEAMRIDSSGNLLVGTTSAVSAGRMSMVFDGTNYNGISLQTTRSATGTDFVRCVNSSGTTIGNIEQNATNTVAYLTSSDYRLKENIVPMVGALEKVATLKPVTYNWKEDGSTGQGFIAHELQAVVPECVTGAKDAVDEEGNPVYQGIDTSFLVATLTAAIKEQQAIITSLTDRITALENK